MSDVAQDESGVTGGDDPPRTPARRARRPVDLGLDGSISLARVFDRPGPASRSRRPSPGRLREGLEELDAERGISRASPVVREANRLASSEAPEVGLATFEIVTDSEGVVQAVRLVGSPLERLRWEHLAKRLRDELSRSRLRVPPGANGLLMRLRIERGELAKTPEERVRSERAVALGQEPSHPGVHRNESTRASEDPGRLAPTLVGRIGARDPTPTRVVLLFSEAF